jgi:tetratricopeptide (TPR) repeat protein
MTILPIGFAPEEAAEALERLVRLSDASQLAPLGEELAGLYDELVEGEKACEALERVVESGSATPELRDRLRALYQKLESWQRLAELVAGDAELAESTEEKVRHLRAAASLHLDKLGDGEAAAGLLQRATELRPDDRALLLQLCDVLSASGRSREAVEALQRIVDSYGGRRSKELGEIHRRLARAFRGQGNDAEALKELDQAFRIEPGNVGILKELGELALDLGELKKAQQMYRALLLQRLDDGSPISKAEVFYSLGRVHHALGEAPKAKQMLERAIQTDSSLDAARRLLDEL